MFCTVLTSYSKTDSEGNEEHGYTDNRGNYFVLESVGDDLDSITEDFTSMEDLTNFLDKHGAIYPSNSHFSPGTWYSTEEEHNYRTGEVIVKSLHLNGLTDQEQKQVFDHIVHNKKVEDKEYDAEIETSRVAVPAEGNDYRDTDIFSRNDSHSRYLRKVADNFVLKENTDEMYAIYKSGLNQILQIAKYMQNEIQAEINSQRK